MRLQLEEQESVSMKPKRDFLEMGFYLQHRGFMNWFETVSVPNRKRDGIIKTQNRKREGTMAAK